jgi:predicted amidohydrolase
MMKLRITLVQSNIYWESPEKNRGQLEAKLLAKSQTDLVILPELFNTAFSVTYAGEPMSGETIQWMSRLASKLEALIIGSLIINEKGKKYNRLICMYPEGSYHYYDKRHLFDLMNESSYFTAGKDRLIINFKGWKLCPLICYDLRFPVFSRNNEEFDILIYVANWPASRIDHWNKLLVARAIENQCYVAAVNRVGSDINGIDFSGHSSLIDYNGHIIYRGNNNEQLKTFTINKTDLNLGRSKLPFLKDVDSFVIN